MLNLNLFKIIILLIREGHTVELIITVGVGPLGHVDDGADRGLDGLPLLRDSLFWGSLFVGSGGQGRDSGGDDLSGDSLETLLLGQLDGQLLERASLTSSSASTAAWKLFF